MKGPTREDEVYTVRILRDTSTGVAITEHWSKAGCGTHREDGPAAITRDAQSGVVKSEAWYRTNGFHREDGPAIIERDPKTGIVTDERWMRNEKYHREDGPAIIKRRVDTGKIYFTQWYHNDVKITPPSRPKARAQRRAGPSFSPENT